MADSVVICIKWISHYRREFYELLREQLAANSVELRVIYGEPKTQDDRAKRDWVELDWGIRIENVLVGPFLWQPALRALEAPKLIIVEQANRLLLNYVLLALREPRRWKLAYWGHGRKFQGRTNRGPSAALKRWLACKVDWWFAYNKLSATYIEELGYPRERITEVANAIDTKTLRDIVTSLTSHEVDAFKESLGIRDAIVGIYCGGLYPEKRIDMLLATVKRVQHSVPRFSLLIVGAGPETRTVQEFVKDNPCIHYLGPRFGRDKALALRAADIYVNAGLVGLGILDAFASGLPVVVSDYPFHSPEIAYLDHGINGLISNDNVDDFAAAIVACLSDDLMRKHLAAKALGVAETYTVEKMVDNFSSGILSCLSTDPLRA